MVLWIYFAGAAGAASESLISEQALVRKVYFPRELLPLGAIGAAVVDLAPALVTLGAVAALYGVTPAASWVAIPVVVLLLVLFAAAVGLGLSAINVYYRDVRYVLPFILQVGLFATPVVYPLGVVPATWRELYAVLNPVAAAIDGLRRIVVHGAWPDGVVTAGAFAWTLVLLAGGYALFKRLERGFSDRI
jgi:lipopolysaccharide transport system permease protein